ncbi:MAG: TonB-dependent receptor [Sulfuricella sp.]|nr:TonB-dependent receptor [Sulfuricella sp.]
MAEDTAAVGRIVVEGDVPGNGMMTQEETPKARSSVARAAMEEKSSLNNPFQMLDLLPGVNSFSFDATGLFGGGVRMRGFSSDQLGVTVDGVPVNDAGNFSVFPSELNDIENLQEIFITQGSTDIDAPHIGAAGGNIGLVTSSPVDQSRLRVQQTFGSNNAYKTFVRADTGYLGDNLFKGFISYSKAEADKWKGAGQAEREHVDFKGVLNVSPGNSITAGLMWNKMLNNNLRTLSLTEINTLGRNTDFGTVSPQHLAGVSGVAQVEKAPANGYYNLNLNPFENYIATLKGNFQLTPELRLDVEPYYWYGYGTGGSQLRTTAESKTTSKLGGGIRDINRDGDTLDTVMIYSSGLTETHRPGVTFKLSTQVDNHQLIAGYWYEHSRHRRTQPAVAFSDSGNSVDPWLKNSDNFILRQDGTPYQGRDFLTVSTSSSLFVQDTIGLMNDRLNLQLGLRQSGIKRDFTNFASEGGGATYNVLQDYSKTLPSLGARYQLNPEQQVFFNVAENFRAPPDAVYYGLIKGGTFVNNVLTGYTIKAVDVTAETATNWDLGYRYAGKEFSFSGALFFVDFKNRIAVAYDPINAESTNYNVGDSTTKGFELESAWRFQPKWSVYGSLTYTRSRIGQNLQTGASTYEATAGKEFPDVPNWMMGAALQYRDGPWSANLSAKYTGRRYSTLVNDESIGGFTVVNFDTSYRIPSTGFFRNPALRFNVYNLFNQDYLYLTALSGSSFTTRAQGVGGSAPSYYVGAPRTVSVMLGSDF